MRPVKEQLGNAPAPSTARAATQHFFDFSVQKNS
jgi:hypothetical protein